MARFFKVLFSRMRGLGCYDSTKFSGTVKLPFWSYFIKSNGPHVYTSFTRLLK